MFTGIIREIGKIKKIVPNESGTEFEVVCQKVTKNKKIGESITVNGVCTSIVAITNEGFSFQAIPETLKITNLKSLKADDKVNLEPSLTLEQGLDGHMVQGHVDCEAEVINLNKEQDESLLTIKFPAQISDYLAFKGSITVNGVSLTIAKLENNQLSTALIPQTLEHTNFSILKEGDKVNIEVDLIARYLKQLLDKKEKEATHEFLKERNLI